MATKTRSTKRTAPAEPTLVRGELVYIDPATLLIGENVRTEVDLDNEFLNSLAEFGVLQPITAYHLEQELHVKEGQRRTLGAVKVGLKEVPVLIVPPPDNHARRILTQLTENIRRADMTAGDKATALDQLTLFGIPARDIVRTGVATADEVKAAARVAKSAKAQQVSAQHALTVPQASVVAEFDDDDEAVQRLIEAAPTGKFLHVAQQLRDARDRKAYKQKLTDQLTKAEVLIIDEPNWYSKNSGKVEDLRDRHGALVDPKNHKTCPGHAAYITAGGYGSKVPYKIGYACADLAANSHYTRQNDKLRSRDMTDDERAAAKTERKDIRDSNLEWDSAQTVRRDFLREFATGKESPKRAARFVAESWARADHELTQALSNGNDFALELLGIKPTGGKRACDILADQISRASEARAQMIALVLVLCAYERRTGRHSWRTQDPATARYLLFLQQLGYVLSEVERRACGLAVTAPPTTPDPADAADPAESIERDHDASPNSQAALVDVDQLHDLTDDQDHGDAADLDKEAYADGTGDNLELRYAAELAAADAGELGL